MSPDVQQRYTVHFGIFCQFCKSNGIHHKLLAPYDHPSTIGEAKCFTQTFKLSKIDNLQTSFY